MKNKFYSTIKKYYDYIFPLNPAQVDFVCSEFADNSSKLIEIGCANGKLTNALSDYDIRGIDLEQSFVDIARDRYPNVRFDALNMLELESLNETFDGIVCFGNTLVHLHMNEIESFIAQCYHSLNDGGRLLIQILNYDNILDNRISELPLIDNDKITFKRSYELGHRIKFITELTVKQNAEKISNEISLTPIKKNQLESIIKNVGFKDIIFYGSFAKMPLKEKSLPLIISCVR